MSLPADIRVAFRSLLKSRGLAFVVVLTLGVAIGAHTAIFSVVESVLLSPLPYPNEERVVRVAATVHESAAAGRGDRGNTFSDRGYWLFVNNNRSFEKFGGYSAGTQPLPLTGDGSPRQVRRGGMTLNAFEVLGVLPELGRLPTPEEDAPNGALVVLLSHELWSSQYGADPAILGKIITLDGTPREVIGVMPAGFDFPAPEAELWTPMRLDPASANFGGHYIMAIARLAPGVTIDAAAADARSLVARFSEIGYGPAWFQGVYDGGAVVRPLRDYIVGSAREPLLIVLGIVAFVLLIACSNIANLLLVRAESRRQENAVRMALGASRGRLARLMLIESAILALLGGAAGVLLAYAGTRALVAIGPTNIPRLGEIGIDGASFAFTAAAALLAGVLFGMLPALASGSSKAIGALRDGGRNATLGRAPQRTRNVLVVTPVALAFALGLGSGLMVRSFDALRSVDPGFQADGVLTFNVRPLPTKYQGPEALARFYDSLIERLNAVPGVTRAGGINALPLGAGTGNLATFIEEFPPAQGEFPPTFLIYRATPGYFEAMSIPVVEGRSLTRDDHNDRLGSVVINSSLKERFWPNTSALGKRMSVAGISVQVVGVVGDVHAAGLDVEAPQVLYLPMLDVAGAPPLMAVGAMTITVRTSVEPLSVVPAIRGAIAELDADLPIANVRSMQDVVGISLSRSSFMMALLVIAALIALFLGSVGIYGVLSYIVTTRTAEIGVRSALGASPERLRRLVLFQGLRLAVVGVVIGVAGAVALGRVIEAQLYGVSPVDPFTLIGGAAIFLAVAVLASLLPAVRAARTAPVDALRAT